VFKNFAALEVHNADLINAREIYVEFFSLHDQWPCLPKWFAGEGDITDVRERFGVDDVEYVRFYRGFVAAASPRNSSDRGGLYTAAGPRQAGKLDGAQDLVIFSHPLIRPFRSHRRRSR